MRFCKKQFLTLIVIILPFLLFCQTSGIVSYGGGTIVTGFVVNQNGNPVPGAKVVLAKKGCVSLNDTTNFYSNGMRIEVIAVFFDTVYCDISGRFEYDTLQNGDYTIVASDGNLIGLKYINLSRYSDPLNIKIDFPSILTIKPYFPDSPDSLRFVAAQITGTDIIEEPDSNGIFNFRKIPTGELEVALKHKNSRIETIADISIHKSECDRDPTIMVDPTRPPDFWTIKDCELEYRDRPFVSWFMPFKNSQQQLVLPGNDVQYDIAIQFSHPMNSRLTEKAISIKSSDSCTVLDSIWWYQADMVYLTLCTKYGTQECVGKDSLYKEHVIYSVTVDTSAQSTAGVHLSYPEIITFTPKP